MCAAARARRTSAGLRIPNGSSWGSGEGMTSLLKQSDRDPKRAVSNVVVGAGEPYIGRIARGHYFRIVDLEGNQAVDTLFYDASNVSERYSAADTIRKQRKLYLSTGTVLYSNLAK